ncbi:MAG: hypothetical protein U9R05_01245 [Chloroflexota bacterium]|nr:hypothetical protein [Chloroflexota bacterium]
MRTTVAVAQMDPRLGQNAANLARVLVLFHEATAHGAQLGANASAGLNAHGGPQLRQFSGSINDITGQLARGQMPHNLGNLERALGSRPSRP